MQATYIQEAEPGVLTFKLEVFKLMTIIINKYILLLQYDSICDTNLVPCCAQLGTALALLCLWPSIRCPQEGFAGTSPPAGQGWASPPLFCLVALLVLLEKCHNRAEVSCLWPLDTWRKWQREEPVPGIGFFCALSEGKERRKSLHTSVAWGEP